MAPAKPLAATKPVTPAGDAVAARSAMQADAPAIALQGPAATASAPIEASTNEAAASTDPAAVIAEDAKQPAPSNEAGAPAPLPPASDGPAPVRAALIRINAAPSQLFLKQPTPEVPAPAAGLVDAAAAPPRSTASDPSIAETQSGAPVQDDAIPPAPKQDAAPQIAQVQSTTPVDGSPMPPSPPAKAENDNEIDLRRPSGAPPIQEVIPDIDPSQVPPPTPLLPRESLPLPDRWRIVETLGIKDDPFNPYAQNLLKGDKPIPAGFGLGPDWFVNLGIISDTVLETHNIPTPISSSGVINAGAVDQLGRGTQSIFNQTYLFSASLIKGDTSFKPPDYELRIVPAFNGNIVHAEESGVLEANPADGLTRRDGFAGLQEAYLETHLRNVSDRYDFDSVRIGIQPFTSDFRGFVFQDDALGIRFFGNRDNNTWQYNLAWLQRIEKDTNSGLNDITAPLRKDTTFIANLYHQDFPIQGNTTQVTVMHNINHDEDQYVNADGFQVRPAEVGDGLPHKYEVTYVGLNTDGHFGRFNLTSSFYGVFGHDSRNEIAQRPQTVQAGFAAVELSRDFDWIRVRASAVYATGDRDVNDNKSTGFDAILENPDIAGAGTSFWIRQAIPLIGGGGVALNGRDGLLPDLRSSKDDGQSNFVNPGLLLIGVGADADVTPNLRVLGNISHLSFDNTSVLEALRAQGTISRDIGLDVSTAIQYRPFLTQNIVVSASIAALVPGEGFKELYNTQRLGLPYSVLLNMVLRY
jgi:hypothetical protein